MVVLQSCEYARIFLLDIIDQHWCEVAALYFCRNELGELFGPPLPFRLWK